MNGNVRPMEMEPALNKGVINGRDEEPEQRHFNPLERIHTFYLLIVAYVDYYQEVTIAVVSLIIITFVIIALDKIAYATTSKTHAPGIYRDYSNFRDIDVQLGKLDHWCLQGGDDNCICDDPTIGLSKQQVKGWTNAHKLNKKLIEKAPKELDVVFLGDAAVEELNGRWLGQERDELSGIKRYFNKTFSIKGGGEVDGIALGVAGDTISNLLWRIKHGELPSTLYPKVWWILIGSNDLGHGQCAEEVVLVGILNLVQQIAHTKPDSIVVINSILPRPNPIKLKHNKKPLDLWPYIQDVNKELKNYCANHTNLFYYDAHALFVSEESADGVVVNKALMEDGTHLKLAGHKAWGSAILPLLKEWKAKSEINVATMKYAGTENDYDFDDDNGPYDDIFGAEEGNGGDTSGDIFAGSASDDIYTDTGGDDVFYGDDEVPIRR